MEFEDTIALIVYNPDIMLRRENEFRRLLKQVSRSFYLTLHVLPKSIKWQVSLAYLLARATDTIADTQFIPVSRRREALLQLQGKIREACEGNAAASPEFGDLAEAQQKAAGEGTPAERLLLLSLKELLEGLAALTLEDRFRIRKLLDTIVQGQETDLVRFGTNRERITALSTDEELDTYTYDVAGCVGEFWTEMCRAHVFPAARLDDARLIADGIRFGKGLQLVNILRDLPKDLRLGRCYIPEAQLSNCGLKPADLLDPAAMVRFRPLYDKYLRQAEEHLAAGWRYTTALPFRCVRIRLACAWPILIGVETLTLLSRSNILDETNRIKVPRSDIRRLMLRSMIFYPYPSSWKHLFR